MALRTNNKKVTEKVRNYIIDSFHDSDFEEWHNVHVEDYETICTIILSAFWKEKIELDKRHMSDKALFFEWCAGLPSILGCEYYYNVSAIDLLGGWLEQTEEQRNKYTEEDAEALITDLIWRELNKSGHYLPRISKADFMKLCGDYATYKPFGQSYAFECPELGSNKHSTVLLTEDVHFTITL